MAVFMLKIVLSVECIIFAINCNILTFYAERAMVVTSANQHSKMNAILNKSFQKIRVVLIQVMEIWK